MKVKSFYDENTSTFTYVVSDIETDKCAVIDSVINYDIYSGKASTESADEVIKYIEENSLDNEWIIETHIHADHVSAAYYLKDRIGGKTGIGSGISKVLEFWVDLFENEKDTPLTGEQFDVLFKDEDRFKIGNSEVRVIHTPGHTPACVSYIVDDAVFVGDAIFAPNIGCGRCDFPGGSASTLYDSIQKIYALPDETKIYLCHDYPAKGEDPRSITTVAEQKKNNILIKEKTSKDDFVQAREGRDAGKLVPKLIIPSIQTNIRLGDFGQKSTKGVQFIKVPVNRI